MKFQVRRPLTARRSKKETNMRDLIEYVATSTFSLLCSLLALVIARLHNVPDFEITLIAFLVIVLSFLWCAANLEIKQGSV